MPTDYDPIAEQYKRSKQQPWRAHIESFTLLGAIGDLRGLAVVDLACGEGFYTRQLKQRGADRVLGVDLSERMIGLARAQEERQSLGVGYRVGDALDLRLADTFDLAVAAYLLNYARTEDELLAMCRGVARSLKPGGRFVAVNSNPAIDFRTAPCYRSYGFETRTAAERRPGTPITWTFFLEEGSFSIENYYLDVAAHERALRAAGFTEILWRQPQLSPQGVAEHGQDFWASFLDHPPVTCLECRL